MSAGRRRPRTPTDDGGLAAMEFVLFTGLLLLPTLVLVLWLPTWWERQALAQAAAQEASRALADAPTWPLGVAAGEQLVARMAANHGIPGADLDVTFSGALERGSAVTATVSVAVPAARAGTIVLPGFTLTTNHTEAVDSYRSLGGRR